MKKTYAWVKGQVEKQPRGDCLSAMEVIMKKCTKCILPENYPGITFNESGTCNHCIAHRERKYRGDDALKEKISSFLKTKRGRNRDYDCVLGLSGGRDSSYLLYYLVKILNLRVLAYSADNGFIPEQTKLNMKNMSNILNVKLQIEEHEHLKKCIKHHMLSWMRKPSPAMVGMLCMGCKSAIDLGLLSFARKNKIPIIIGGGTPFEGQGYKVNMMKLNPNSKSKYSFIAGWLYQIIKNPQWVLNSTCLLVQFKEYYYHYLRKAAKTKELLYIAPFRYLKRWEEKEVISTLENELNWKRNTDTESTWRGDCDIALLKLYLYKKCLGFNDKDDGLSSLIRDKQITRQEALERVHKEGEISEKVIRKIFDKLGLKYSDLSIALKKIRNA